MIDAFGITNQGVGESRKINEAVPVGAVACKAGDLQSEHESDMTKRHLGREPGKA